MGESMYQFYYADQKQKYHQGVYMDDITNHFKITKIRPTMWEEHCLECSAPFCYNTYMYKRKI